MSYIHVAFILILTNKKCPKMEPSAIVYGLLYIPNAVSKSWTWVMKAIIMTLPGHLRETFPTATAYEVLMHIIATYLWSHLRSKSMQCVQGALCSHWNNYKSLVTFSFLHWHTFTKGRSWINWENKLSDRNGLFHWIVFLLVKINVFVHIWTKLLNAMNIFNE